ncbi:uncharacterized protein LOC127059599 isoform X21 [Serinus canaria]|uniref:uncharacterized protein LOC127059599 isoform X21 n=1 Tax=Serinus canaria TaxID=9135 RepID=UPI0021CCB670|nr:uncharacterized protein LOC127059599 isoform X21 [Serinus canaria]
MKQNLKTPSSHPCLIPRLDFTSEFPLLPSSAGGWRLWSVHHVVPAAPSSSFSSLASMGFFHVSSCHRVQSFRKGCSRVGPPRGHSKPPAPQAPLPVGSARSLIQCGLPPEAPLGTSPWLHPGLLPRLQVDPCSIQGSFPGCRWIPASCRAPSQAAGGSLLHPGLLPRLQVHLCSIQGSFPGCRWIPASCRAPSQAASASLLHPGLIPRLQVHLCSIQGSFPGCRCISAPSRAPSQAAGASLLHRGPPWAAGSSSCPSFFPALVSAGLLLSHFPLLSLAAVALTLTRLFLPSQICDPSSALPCWLCAQPWLCWIQGKLLAPSPSCDPCSPPQT